MKLYDKFHVMKTINEALDKVRKREVHKNEILKNSKYLLLKNRSNLKEEQKKLEILIKSEYLETRYRIQI